MVIGEVVHTDWLFVPTADTSVMVLVGFTSTVAVIGVPGQPLAVGVTVKATVIGLPVVLVSVPLILPEPLADIPVTVAVLSRVQLNTVPDTLPLSTIPVIGNAEHTVCDDGVAKAFGVGFTSTVEVIGLPGQPFAIGVMVKVTVTGAKVVLVNVPLIVPEPLADMPVADTVLSRVQLNTVPETTPVKVILSIATPEHLVCDVRLATAFGVGFTSTVAVIDGPGQPAAVGVIVKVTVTGAFVVLVSVPMILPEPLAVMPVAVAVLSRVQLNNVPDTFPLRTIVVIAVAEHTVCEAGVATAFGVGFTSTVAVIGLPGQPLAVGVMVKVTVTGAFVVLVNVPLILPLPLAAMPDTVAVLSRVQLNTVPGILPVSAIVVIAMPEHLVCDAGVATAFGVGFTKTEYGADVPVQPLPSVEVTPTVCVPAVFQVTVIELVPVPEVIVPPVTAHI